MKKIAALVVTYNRCELLIECIEALLQSEVKVDIIVIDNASTDGTGDKIKPYIVDKKILYYNTGANIGGAGGFNFGIKKAYELGYDFFWLMDDDTIVERNSLTYLIEVYRTKENCGFLSSLAVWKDGNVCVMNGHKVSNDWNKSKIDIKNGILKISVATFVSFFTSREVVEDVGLPIKEYFVWGDDTEYTNRISQKYSCYFVANSQVMHKMISNESAANFVYMDDLDRIERMYMSTRNDCCTYRRLGVRKYIRFTVSTITMFFRIFFWGKPYKIKKMSVLLRGYISGIFFNPQIEKLK